MIATLFDFDGVLVDSEPVHLAAFNDVLSARGVVIDEAEYAAHYLSLDDAAVFRAVLSARAGAPPSVDDVAALVAAKSPRFMARFDGAFQAFPGAAELVARRAARGPVAIVSGARTSEIEHALARMGVRDRVAFVVSAESTRASKPDPEPYLLALRELRARGHWGRAVVVEDSIGGVTSAKRASLRCVAVTHSYARADLVRAGADAVADSLPALHDALLDAEA